MRDRCVRCHSLALVMCQGRTREQWEALVTRMGTYPIGAPNPVGYALTGKPELRKRIIDSWTHNVLVRAERPRSPT